MTSTASLTSPQTPLVCGNCESTEEVLWHCKNCKGDLCIKCKETHTSEKKMFNSHQVISRSDAIKLKREEQCPLHPFKNLITYCDECLKLVCVECLSTEHRGHALSEIDNALRKIQDRLEKFRDNFELKVLLKCRTLEEHITKSKSKNLQRFNFLKAEIEERRQDLIKHLNDTCDQLVNMAASEKNKNDQVIGKFEQELKSKMAEVNLLKSRLEDMSMLKDTEKNQLTEEIFDVDSFKMPQMEPLDFSNFIAGKINKDRLSEQLGILQSSTVTSDQVMGNELESNTHKEPFSFKEKKLQNIKNIHVSALETDTHDLEYKSGYLLTHSQGLESVTSPVPLKESFAPYQAVFRVQVHQRQKFDFSVDTIVPVSADQAWVNRRGSHQLRLINMKGEILKAVNTDFEIENFDVLTSDEIVAADYWGKCIKVLSNTGCINATIPTSGLYPSGICVCEPGENVAVATDNGELGATLVVYKLHNGQVVFSTPLITKSVIRYSPNTSMCRLTQNKNGEFWIVRSAYRTVYVVDNAGKVKVTYKGSDDNRNKFEPWDICCDKYNNILISDRYNSTIHVLSQHGNLIRYLLSAQDGINHPPGLGIDTGGRLWVGDEDGNASVVNLE